MHYRFKMGEETLTYDVDPVKENHLKVSTGEKTLDVSYTVITDHYVYWVVDGVGVNAFVTGEKGEKTILIRGVPYVVCDADRAAQTRKSARDLTRLPLVITPPMPSVVIRIMVAEGDNVQKGDSVIVLTARTNKRILGHRLHHPLPITLAANRKGLSTLGRICRQNES